MTNPIETALTLLRMALGLLDAADPLDEGLAALRVQTAIDAVAELIAAMRDEER